MALEEETDFEHTLAVFREVSAFKIPPRLASGGVKSGEWRVEDKIFTGRLTLMSCGHKCELRLTDDKGEVFAVCPVGVGERLICVEPASDSSRNFVIRVVDPASRRHAFLGMGFIERSDAFDFNVALSDWDKQTKREQESSTASGAACGQAPKPAMDFSLKEGQTISVKKVAPASGSGFLASLGSGGGGGGGNSSDLGMLAPPPAAGGGSSDGGAGLLPPPPPPAVSSSAASGNLGLRPPPPPGGAGGFGLVPPPPPAGAKAQAAGTSGTAGAMRSAASSNGNAGGVDTLLRDFEQKAGISGPASSSPAATEEWTAFS